MDANSIFNSTSIAQGILSNIAFQLIILIVGFVHKDLKLFNFQLRDVSKLSVALKRILYLAVVNVAFLAIAFFIVEKNALQLSIVTSIFFVIIYAVYVTYNCSALLKRMIVAGIAEVDDTVEGGISYKKSLELSNQSIRFLGIGANKITQLDEFKRAIELSEQNHSEDKVFLICDPRSPALRKMEERNEQNSGNYKGKIVESLREIQKLKQQHYNIKVFLYSANEIEDIPVFRLFFINADSVLVSFYAISKNNDAGKKLPQIKFSRTGPSSSFFFAFNSYYSNIKSSSVECTDIEGLIKSL